MRPLIPKEDVADVVVRMKAAKPEVMKRQVAFLRVL
jgi:hypothetical protein